MFSSNCDVTLFRRSIPNDGVPVYGEGELFRGFFMEHHRTGTDGTSEDLSELLLPPESLPCPGDAVEIEGLRRHIAGVRSCTGAKGCVKACRCTFVR